MNPSSLTLCLLPAKSPSNRDQRCRRTAGVGVLKERTDCGLVSAVKRSSGYEQIGLLKGGGCHMTRVPKGSGVHNDADLGTPDGARIGDRLTVRPTSPGLSVEWRTSPSHDARGKPKGDGWITESFDPDLDIFVAGASSDDLLSDALNRPCPPNRSGPAASRS